MSFGKWAWLLAVFAALSISFSAAGCGKKTTDQADTKTPPAADANGGQADSDEPAGEKPKDDQADASGTPAPEGGSVLSPDTRGIDE